MNDRKLLELAAKAAGITLVTKTLIGSKMVEEEVFFQMFDDGTFGCWNPLIDDGDALKLAVKLERFSDSGFWANVFEIRNGFDFGVDEFAATRRAIVRAAAEIGRTA